MRIFGARQGRLSAAYPLWYTSENLTRHRAKKTMQTPQMFPLTSIMIREGITMKKLVSVTVLLLALLTVLPVSAFARGHGGAAKQTAALRAAGNCDIAGSHYHDGVLCDGYSIGGGYDCRQPRRGGGHC
jgi:hypothetical protein